MKYIGLLDCNNFFVSCERVFRPDLKTRPTVVLSSNDGCVVARSKEIKEMGVPMGVPYFKVKEELKKANTAVFSSNFALYRDISRRVMDVLTQEVGYVEQYSVDEAFFEVEGEANDLLDSLWHVKYTVEKAVGVPVSVGAAKTKTIAKYASEVGKQRDGVALVYGEEWKEAQKSLPVETIWGIGKQTSQKMHKLGITTVAELLACDRTRIDQIFGIGGLRICDELNEQRISELGSRDSLEIQKSIMSTRSFAKATTERAVIEDALAYHVAHIAEEMRELGVKAGWLSILVATSRHGDWMLRGGRSGTFLLRPTNDTSELLLESRRLLDGLFESTVPYKKAGVVVGNFTDESVVQMNLFEKQTSRARNDLMKTLDVLNRRYGKETVTIGRNFTQEKWQTSTKFVSPNYTTNWGEIAEIKA